MTDLFLGFDLSTQSLSVVVINSSLTIIKEDSVNFDSELSYGTKGEACCIFLSNINLLGGVIHGEKDTVTSPVLMWVSALDLLLTKLKKGNLFKSNFCQFTLQITLISPQCLRFLHQVNSTGAFIGKMEPILLWPT